MNIKFLTKLFMNYGILYIILIMFKSFKGNIEGEDSKVAQCRIFISGRVSRVAGQCCLCSQKGWQGESMCRFPRSQ